MKRLGGRGFKLTLSLEFKQTQICLNKATKLIVKGEEGLNYGLLAVTRRSRSKAPTTLEVACNGAGALHAF